MHWGYNIDMNTQYAILYFEINFFSLVLIGIILRKTKGLSKMVAQRNFVLSIISEMVFFASDTLCILINCNLIRGNSAVFLACKNMYFFSTAVMCFFWFLYFEYIREAAYLRDRKIVLISSAGIWIMGGLLIFNTWGEFLFYIDENGVYQRGALFGLTYVFSYVYIFISWIGTVGSIIKKNSSKDTAFIMSLILFPIAPGASGIVQFYFPWIPAACVTMSISTLLLYLGWTDQLISIDLLTGLSNRKQLVVSFDQWKKSVGTQEKIYLMLVDADHFKHINDTYGHLQGDNALKIIAKALKTECRDSTKRPVIARYGGDEFVVLLASDNDESVKELKRGINDRLDEIIAEDEIPFELTVSIGTACLEGDESLKELIAKADEAMYSEKKGNASHE